MKKREIPLTGCLRAPFLSASPPPFPGGLLLKPGDRLSEREGEISGSGPTAHLGTRCPFSCVSQFNFSYSTSLHSELAGRQ